MDSNLPRIASACPECGATLTRAATVEAGSKAICPSCGAAAGAPAQKATSPEESSSLGEYALRADDDAVAVVAIGETTVPVNPSPRDASTPSAELAGEEYAVREEPSLARTELSQPTVWHTRVYPEDDTDRPREPDSPPRRPLLQGVFEFPFRRDGAACLLHLWFWGVPTLFLFGLAGLLSGMGASPEGNGGPAPAAFTFFALAAAFTSPWLGLSFACGLKILSETTAGDDRIEDFPRLLDYRDWFGDAFFVVNSLVLTCLPAAGLGWLIDWIGGGSDLAGVAGLAVFLATFPFVHFWFPLVLLSMLENDSRIPPFSPQVFRSLEKHWKAWAAFYAEAAAMWISALLAMAAIVNMPMPFSVILTWLLFPLILSASLMIYFRLLGRLAWCCSNETTG